MGLANTKINVQRKIQNRQFEAGGHKEMFVLAD
jgi:hypothetical protein